uniref:Uncharacterized protein n=1 Tax=viral metagenome TaxID=1070528 RepID=A0A6C0AP09_9ZZZZ
MDGFTGDAIIKIKRNIAGNNNNDFKRFGTKGDLTYDQFIRRMLQQDSKCYICLQEFKFDGINHCYFFPSPDRINNSDIHTDNNIAISCTYCNIREFKEDYLGKNIDKICCYRQGHHSKEPIIRRREFYLKTGFNKKTNEVYSSKIVDYTKIISKLNEGIEQQEIPEDSIKENIIQYILENKSFSETDIAIMMQIMFKQIYKTDANGLWYRFDGEKWALVDSFDVREEIGLSLSRMIKDCIEHIKSSPKIQIMNIANNQNAQGRYETIINYLIEKKNLLMDKNRIDEASKVRERIKAIVEHPESIDANKINIESLDYINILKKIGSKTFKDTVMKDMVGLFYVSTE